MNYASLVDVFQRLDATTSNNEKTAILAEVLQNADTDELPIIVKMTRGKSFADWQDAELGISSNLTLRAISKATGIDEELIEEEWRQTGDLGDAAAFAIENRKQQTLLSSTLNLELVHETLQELATYEGEGSQQRRIDTVAELLADADPQEARYLIRTVVGTMRLGIGEGTVRDAIAEAFLNGDEDSVDIVERAHQVTNDFGVVAHTARGAGRDGLTDLRIELFRPIKAMLAQKAESIEAGRDDLGSPLLVEYKYDGIRIKIHKRGDEIRLFTRRLENVTRQFPDIVEAVQENLTAEECILEGEVVGYDPETFDKLPFQRLAQRIRRKEEIDEAVTEIPVTVYLFDALYIEGDSLLDTALRTRLDRLTNAFVAEPRTLERTEHLILEAGDDGREFYEQALADSHEGVMLKNLSATYQPGSRVGYMLKVKPTMEPLDLVIVGAEYSEGRKSDFLGRLHLACRDEDDAETFYNVGNMHSGLTDVQLQEMTERLEPLITDRDGREVTVTPEVIVEVEYEEIQESPQHNSEFALRFPRFNRFRDELGLGDVDTHSRVRELHEHQ